VGVLRGFFGDGDGVSDGLDPVLEPLCLNGRIVTALEVVGTGVLVEGFRGRRKRSLQALLAATVANFKRLVVLDAFAAAA